MRRKQLLGYGFLIAALAGIAAAALTGEVSRERGFICENTASRKGHREWAFGLRTDRWYEESALEQFMEEHYAGVVTHRWTSYMGTLKNAFGTPIGAGHSDPGTIVLLKRDVLNQWVDRSEPAAVRSLYDVLVSDNEDEIAAQIQKIHDEVSQDTE